MPLIAPAVSGHATAGPSDCLQAVAVFAEARETRDHRGHFERACCLEQIDDLGLGPTERKYLAILAEGPTRLNVISTILGLPTRTVSEVTEQFLIRSGLIDKDKNRNAAIDRERTGACTGQ